MCLHCVCCVCAYICVGVCVFEGVGVCVDELGGGGTVHIPVISLQV